MANLIITKNCNLNCPYCFAQNYMSSSGNENITLEQLENILTFFSNVPNKVHHISLMGGEPLLHPQFEQIYNRISEFTNFYEIPKSPSIFTNGIELSQYRDIIYDSNIIINVNSPNFIGKENWEKIKKGILELKGNNLITLGINLYLDMEDYSYIFELAEETRLLDIRCSVAAPYGELKNQNRFIYADNNKQLFLNFVEEALENGIQPMIDCNYIPKCRFTEEEKIFLEDANIISMDWCYPALDILPNMQVYSCFGFQNPVNLLDFNDLEEIENYFINNYTVPKIELRADCINCPLELYSTEWNSEKCQGGCLGFNN